MATHDVLTIRLNRPPGYNFTPGQATEVAINKPGWTQERRPFTFTCLPEDPFLEFTIKTYPSRAGVTNELLQLRPGDELIIHDVWGAIAYKGEGVFIAGGAGITPFLSIFRHLYATHQVGANKLIFANKTEGDIIHKDELRSYLGNNFINILSKGTAEGYAHGYLTREFLQNNLPASAGTFYVCGPPPMMETVQKILSDMGVVNDAIVVEL